MPLMRIVGVRNSRRQFPEVRPTVKESAGTFTIWITGLPVPVNTKKVLCEDSRSPLVKCLLTGLSPLSFTIYLIFSPFYLSPAKAGSNKL